MWWEAAKETSEVLAQTDDSGFVVNRESRVTQRLQTGSVVGSVVGRLDTSLHTGTVGFGKMGHEWSLSQDVSGCVSLRAPAS